jgi:hypothetical protein
VLSAISPLSIPKRNTRSRRVDGTALRRGFGLSDIVGLR